MSAIAVASQSRRLIRCDPKRLRASSLIRMGLMFEKDPKRQISNIRNTNKTGVDGDFGAVHGEKKRLDVAIVGLPNAGKSQLLNALTGQSIAAVSRKRHTTRQDLLAARTVGNVQLAFVDTPGFLQFKRTKGISRNRTPAAAREGVPKQVVSVAMDEVDSADYTLLVIDAARRITDEDTETFIALMLRAIYSSGRVESIPDTEENLLQKEENQEEELLQEKIGIVLNKVDLVNPKSKLLDLAMEIGLIGDECVRFKERMSDVYEDLQSTLQGLSENVVQDIMEQALLRRDKERDEGTLNDQDGDPEKTDDIIVQSPTVFFVSALQNDGVDDITKHLLQLSTPCNEFALPPELSTNLTPLERIEEVIREKIYRCLHQEVPHSVQQVNRLLRAGYIPAKQGEGKEDSDSDRRNRRAVRIDQDLIVRTMSHYRLVCGRRNTTLQRIQESATRELEGIYGCQVQLNLNVKFSKAMQNHPTKSQGRQGASSSLVGIVNRSL